MRLYSLIKFGSKENIYDLYENGTVYMKTVKYFKELEDNALRGDSYEGTSHITNFPPGRIDLSQENKIIAQNIPYQNLHLRSFPDKIMGNLYCMYAVQPKHLEHQNVFKLDSRNTEFGSHFLTLNGEAITVFLDRVFDKISSKGFEFEYGLVEYYHKYLYTGNVGLFRKTDDYAFQNEFRIYVQYPFDMPFKISIGSIKDIAKVYESKILHGLTYERGDKW